MSFETTYHIIVHATKPEMDPNDPFEGYRGDAPEITVSETCERYDDGSKLFIDNIGYKRLDYSVHLRRADFPEMGDYQLSEIDLKTGMRKIYKVCYVKEEKISLAELKEESGYGDYEEGDEFDYDYEIADEEEE